MKPPRQAAASSSIFCVVDTMVGEFERVVGSVLGIGWMMEAAVGKGSAQPFVREQEQEGNLDALL